jgi:hypothetical protein
MIFYTCVKSVDLAPSQKRGTECPQAKDEKISNEVHLLKIHICLSDSDAIIGLLASDYLRQKTNFLNQINLISPVQSSLQKYSPSRFPQITPITPAPHPLERGAYRDRHETLGWGAVDAAALGAQACSQGGFP